MLDGVPEYQLTRKELGSSGTAKVVHFVSKCSLVKTKGKLYAHSGEDALIESWTKYGYVL